MKRLALSITFLFFVCITSRAQEIHPFTVMLDTAQFLFDDAPILRLRNPLSENLFKDDVFPARKGVYPITTTVNLSKPVFFLVVSTPVIGIPEKTLRGCITEGGFKLMLYNSGDVNNFLLNTNDSAQQFYIARRVKKLTTSEYISSLDSFSRFIKRRIAFIQSTEAKIYYQISHETTEACSEYCQMLLADYIIFPYYKEEKNNAYQAEKEIQKRVKIKYPQYWIQNNAGRNFLSVYFSNILLSRYNNSLEKALTSEVLFRHNPIRRYLGYQYYSSLLDNDSSFTDYNWAVRSIDNFKIKYDCSKEDAKMFDKLKEQFSNKGNDITSLFKKQELLDYTGKAIQKDLVKGKVFVYYWASWCIPCLETISTINKASVKYNEQEYKVIFISIDKKQEQWIKVKKDVFTMDNSFRLGNLERKSFFNVFGVSEIPRIFYIEDGKLTETNYSPEKLKKIFSR